MIKVIAFDVFGTVFDLSGVPRSEIKAYADHIRKPEWSPLHLPASWEKLPAHDDARRGIERLRARYTVCTMSNGPLKMLANLSKHNEIVWDAIVPIEMKRVYKPNPAAYETICELFGVGPEEVMIVTANEKFGDLEAAEKLGMMRSLIRCPDSKWNPAIPTINDLAENLWN